MDSGIITPYYNNDQTSVSIENEFYSNSNAPLPAQFPQNNTPQENNNLVFQLQSYPYETEKPYPYNQDQSQPYKYTQPNTYQQNSSCSPSIRKFFLLLMSILQFLFVVVEIIILIVNKWIGIIIIHIDEGAILFISILFFLSYFDKCKINLISRNILTGIVWFAGFGMRGMANMFIKDMNKIPILFTLMTIRTFILFFSIPVSNSNSEPLYKLG